MQKRRDVAWRSDRSHYILLFAFITASVTSLLRQTARTSDKVEEIADSMKPLSVCEVLERRTELMGWVEGSRAAFKADWISVRRAEAQERRQRYNSASDQVSYDELELRASPAAPMAKRPGFAQWVSVLPPNC